MPARSPDHRRRRSRSRGSRRSRRSGRRQAIWKREKFENSHWNHCHLSESVRICQKFDSRYESCSVGVTSWSSCPCVRSVRSVFFALSLKLKCFTHGFAENDSETVTVWQCECRKWTKMTLQPKVYGQNIWWKAGRYDCSESKGDKQTPVPEPFQGGRGNLGQPWLDTLVLQSFATNGN